LTPTDIRNKTIKSFSGKAQAVIKQKRFFSSHRAWMFVVF